MVKPIKTAGKSQKQQIAMATKMKKRVKPGVRVMEEIRRYQGSAKNVIPTRPFADLVQSIARDVQQAQTSGFSDTKGRQTRNSRKQQPSTEASKSSASKANVSSKSVKPEVKKKRVQTLDTDSD